MKISTIILAASLIMSGCATGYKANGIGGGFSETRLSDDVYMVSFRGNGLTSKERVQDLTMLRAADLTLDSGYSYFAIMGSERDKSVVQHTAPTTYNTSGNVNVYGNTAYYTGRTTAYGGNTVNITRHKANMLIKCFKKKPSNVMAYSANFIKQSISSKYNIK